MSPRFARAACALLALTLIPAAACLAQGAATTAPATPYLTPEKAKAAEDAITLLRSSGGGSYFSSYGGQNIRTELDAVREQYALVDAELKGATDKRRVAALTQRRDALQKRYIRLTRVSPLQQKVDVKFDDATVAQAAAALSKASGVSITAGANIPDSTRLTVEARRVSLAVVLESAARQAHLVIEPVNLDGEDADTPLGVLLTAPPMLRVNDQTQTFPPAPSPWSAEWGDALPGASLEMVMRSGGQSAGMIPFNYYQFRLGPRTAPPAPMDAVPPSPSQFDRNNLILLNDSTQVEARPDGTVIFFQQGKTTPLNPKQIFVNAHLVRFITRGKSDNIAFLTGPGKVEQIVNGVRSTVYQWKGGTVTWKDGKVVQKERNASAAKP